ncbi:hypothetical protein HBN50_13280 [Halobacteriovorax sp. GB3]|nr:hypothetical protein [Halobacteriovorax sp. GB3]
MTLLSMGIFASTLQIPRSLKIDRNVTLRSKSYFGGQSYIIGYLTPGVRADILEVDTNKRSGVGMKIKITSGPNKGRTGWIYYHKSERRRVFSLFDRDGNNVNPSSRGFHDFFKQTNNLRKIGQQSSNKESEDKIWDKIKSGEYLLDTSNDTGGPNISYRVPIKRNTDGSHYYIVKQTARRLDKLQEIITSDSLTSFLKSCEQQDIVEAKEEVPVEEEKQDEDDLGMKWLPGCLSLAKEDLSLDDMKELTTCSESIKKAITGLDDRRKLKKSKRVSVLTNMFLKLNPKEQEFAAMTLTAFGEAGILTPPDEEMMIVMKVIRNRRNDARKKGHEEATDLDVALQKAQFSMYDPGAPQWRDAVAASAKNPYTQAAIRSYVKFQDARYSPDPQIDNVYHYHREYVTWAKWSRGKKPFLARVDNYPVGRKRKRHNLYANIRWGFAYSPYKERADKIKSGASR